MDIWPIFQVFQNRFDGSIEFYRNSTEYENGFGKLETEFWLGIVLVYTEFIF